MVTPRLRSLAALVDEVRSLLENLWPRPLSAFQRGGFTAEFFSLREQLENSAGLEPQLAEVVRELGQDPGQFCYDPLRLRYLYPGLESVEAAAAVFYAHRDTWYGNSASQVNLWTPVYPVTEAQVFSFYPNFFERPLANNSGDFASGDFVGFGRPPTSGSTFPRALDPLSGGVRYPVEPGEALLFSAAHLHQSNAVRETRISLDFRLVHRGDHRAGLGAPDPDNCSTSAGLEGYRSWL